VVAVVMFTAAVEVLPLVAVARAPATESRKVERISKANGICRVDILCLGIRSTFTSNIYFGGGTTLRAPVCCTTPITKCRERACAT